MHRVPQRQAHRPPKPGSALTHRYRAFTADHQIQPLIMALGLLQRNIIGEGCYVRPHPGPPALPFSAFEAIASKESESVVQPQPRVAMNSAIPKTPVLAYDLHRPVQKSRWPTCYAFL